MGQVINLADSFVEKGRAALNDQHLGEAIEWFERALSVEPNHTGALLGLSILVKMAWAR